MVRFGWLAHHRSRSRRSGAELLGSRDHHSYYDVGPHEGHASLSGQMLDSMILCQTLTLHL